MQTFIEFVCKLFYLENMMEMFNQKLRNAVDALGFENAVTQVSTDLKVSKGSVSSYLNGKIKASQPFLEKFANHYNLNEGDITDARIKTSENAVTIETAPDGKSGKRKTGEGLVPYYDVDFAAGTSIAMFDTSVTKPDYYMDVPQFAGCTAFRAYSDSMERLIKSGSVLFGTQVKEWESHLEYGQIYGIICTDGRRYLKYIKKFKDNPKDYFLLKSENDDYDDMDMPKEKIRNIWLVHGWINSRV